jgi:alkanesulfonate monooxygenase SsuD/methylene tetrahydromethanopterin reductase-like flavin-dependent oxidoreductase (luciferase family)
MMTGKLTFGYLWDFRNPAEFHRAPTDLYAETLDLIAWTETLGFEGAWIPEHHVAEDGYIPAPNIILAAIAARTTRMRFGSSIALAPLHHPLRFAEECAILDVLSNGRCEMALAIGYRRRETEAFGVDFGKRGAIFDEFLQIVRALWAGERVTFEGQYFQLKDAFINPLSPRGQIPLYIGGFAEKALARVAKYADGYFGNEQFCAMYADKLRAEGKDPASGRIRIQELLTVVAEYPAAAMDELAPHFLTVNNGYAAWNNEDKALGVKGMEPMTLDQFKASDMLEIVTPEQAVAKYKGMQERIAVEHVMFSRPPGLSAERFRHYAGLVATQVLPAFA